MQCTAPPPTLRSHLDSLIRRSHRAWKITFDEKHWGREEKRKEPWNNNEEKIFSRLREQEHRTKHEQIRSDQRQRRRRSSKDEDEDGDDNNILHHPLVTFFTYSFHVFLRFSLSIRQRPLLNTFATLLLPVPSTGVTRTANSNVSTFIVLPITTAAVQFLLPRMKSRDERGEGHSPRVDGREHRSISMKVLSCRTFFLVARTLRHTTL